MESQKEMLLRKVLNYKPASIQELLTMPVDLLLGFYKSHFMQTAE